MDHSFFKPLSKLICIVGYTDTPLKIKMDPKNHQIEKEKSSSKPPFLGSMLIFQGIADT